MKISFTQIYSEPGASFDLSGSLLRITRQALDALGKNVKQFSSKFPESNFELVFIISASKNIDELVIKGPNVRRKAHEVEFSLFIPWRESSDLAEKVNYVLPEVAKGIMSVFRRYDEDGGGIDEAISGVIREVVSIPEKYQYARG